MRSTDRLPSAQILLVEDSDTQALQMQMLLESQRCSVQRVASAEEALDALHTRIPDLIIADYHLPGMNGDELARELKLSMSTRTVPVMMLTEARERDLERHGLESGADAYVPKSADQELLLLRIKALLRQAPGSTETRHDRSLGALFRRAQLLLVDDHPEGGARIQALLTQDSYKTSVVQDDKAAVRAVSEQPNRWAAIIINLEDPEAGIALCEQLHVIRSSDAAADEGPLFQIIVLGTGEPAAMRTIVVQSFAAGADDVVPQSADPEVLRVRIRSLVRRAILDEENRRILAEAREQELALERARAKQLAAEEKASMAEALALANQELESANRQLRETQAQLVHAAKMASLGELVAGIAHEINNPLAFILAHQSTIERICGDIEAELKTEGHGREDLLAKTAKARERLDAVRSGLRRIQDLVLNLRKFSRLEEGSFETVNVREAIETVLSLLAPKFGTRISIERNFAAPDMLICSPALLNQAVMNIVSNAADAIPDKGTITISTSCDQDTYRIEIRDTGPGVPSDLRDRIFEPFFTTKPVGSGTGLGLAIAYRVAQAHHGAIEVGPAVGGGACFSLTVPFHSAGAAA